MSLVIQFNNELYFNEINKTSSKQKIMNFGLII